MPFTIASSVSNRTCDSTAVDDKQSGSELQSSCSPVNDEFDGVASARHAHSAGKTCDALMQPTRDRSDSNDSHISLVSELVDAIHQPTEVSELEHFPEQTCAGKTRRFQASWFKRFPWLHLSQSLNAAICYP